jgi:hypothetical protein
VENPPPGGLSRGEDDANGSDEERPTRRCAPVEEDGIHLGRVARRTGAAVRYAREFRGPGIWVADEHAHDSHDCDGDDFNADDEPDANDEFNAGDEFNGGDEFNAGGRLSAELELFSVNDPQGSMARDYSGSSR